MQSLSVPGSFTARSVFSCRNNFCQMSSKALRVGPPKWEGVESQAIRWAGNRMGSHSEIFWFPFEKQSKEFKMPRGGSRPGAGRKQGVPNRRTREMLEQSSAGGELPLQYMLRIMRDGRVSPARRDAMAKAAAQFCHSRLTVAAGSDEGPALVSGHPDWEELLNPRTSQLVMTSVDGDQETVCIPRDQRD